MKWKNKGHEFDELGEIFKKNKDILVIGNEESLKSIKEELDFLGIYIEYNSSILKYLSVPFINNKKIGKNKTIVIADNDKNTLKKILKIKRFKHNKNVFLGEDFLREYLSIYALYICDKVYSGISSCIVMTDYCSLNCKYCLNYEPYIKNKRHRDIKDLKNDIDLFFLSFDRVKYFSLTGGEPFLYPHFAELLEHVSKNYGHKIHTLWFATNGSIMPSDDLLNTIKNSNIEIWLDDYTKNAPHTKNTFEKLLKKCKEMNINHRVSNEMIFIKSFPPKMDYTKYTDEHLIDKYNGCQNPGPELRNGKLYSCCYSGFADNANLVKAKEQDFFDLRLSNFDNGGGYKKLLIEFKLYYSERGYTEFCKYCNGFFGINNDTDENGVTQLKMNEKLEWDINNPTYL